MSNLTQSESKVIEQTILKIVNKSMNPHLLPIFPCLLNNRNPCQIIDLLFNIQLTEQILILLLVRAI